MFEILFPVSPSSHRGYSSEASMKHEKDLLNMAADMLGVTMTGAQHASFPKHNAYRMLDGSPYTYFMEFALAGYDRASLDVKIDNGYLVVSSKTDSDKKEDREYIHRGMAKRDFSTKYYIGKNVEVRSAKFADGLLTVELEKLVPEEQKPKSIEIT
jgi:molecular chaperone IbpA